MNDETTHPAVRIGADGVDSRKLEEEILAAVAAKRAQGVYDENLAARAGKNDLLGMEDDETFVERYLVCLHQVVPVDINDFEILVRKSPFAPVSKAVKKAVWKTLKFYTWRLWSQQNRSNELLLSAIEIMDRKHKKETDALRSRVEDLEEALAALRNGRAPLPG